MPSPDSLSTRPLPPRGRHRLGTSPCVVALATLAMGCDGSGATVGVTSNQRERPSTTTAGSTASSASGAAGFEGAATGGTGAAAGTAGTSSGGMGGSSVDGSVVDGTSSDGGAATPPGCLGDEPLRVDIDATTDGVTYRLCPGVYTTTPVSDANALLAWTAWNELLYCGESPCECEQGWLYTYVVDVEGERPRAINAIPNRQSGCETTDTAFHRHARAGSFTLTQEANVTFRTPDTTTYDNAGGMTLHVERSPVEPLSLDGLVAYWPLDGTWDADSPQAPPWVPNRGGFMLGRMGQAAVFGGPVPQYATGPTSADGCDDPLDVEALPLTVAAWVRPAYGRPASRLGLFATDGGETYTGAWITLERNADFSWGVGAHFGAGLGDDTAQFRSVRTDGGPIHMSEWYHLAVTFHGASDIRIYVHGARVPAGQYSGDATELAVASPRACALLGRWQSPEEELVYEGAIDELYVFSRALSDAEVLALSRL